MIGLALLLSFTPATYADGTGLSPAITEVMQRAQEGIDYALGEDAGSTMLEEAIPPWLEIQLMPLFLGVDTRYALTEESNNLKQSVCFRFDQTVLEDKMEEVQEHIKEAMNERRLTKMIILQDVYEYVNDRYKALLEGGLNPEVADADWDVPFFWELEETNPSEGSAGQDALYYFNTDYLPANISGYGCDRETIEKAQGLLTGDKPGMQKALEMERERADISEKFLEQWTAPDGVNALQQTIDQLIGTDPTPNEDDEPAREPRVHKNIAGYVEKLPDDLVMWSLRGDFSVDHNDLPLLEEFWKQTRNENADAPTPRVFKWLETAHPIFQFFFADSQRDTKNFVTDRAGQTSGTFAVGADPGLSIEDDFEPLRKAVLALVRVGNNQEYGLPSLVQKMAAYIWRICPRRPGNTLLRRAVNAATTPECFPYGNGEYRDNPDIWETCQAAAQ